MDYYYINPDSVRARQTASMLKLAGTLLTDLHNGLDEEAANKICKLLLSSTATIAVSITNKTHVLAFVGYHEENHPAGTPIRTQATHCTLCDGRVRILTSAKDIGLEDTDNEIRAAIIVPLMMGPKAWGTFKFFYQDSQQITETQKSIAIGFGELVSTQLAALTMEEQSKLALDMELRMLQSQINPHFLFNTINTIASITRTDPEKARVLLREFAMFYRSTLENSSELVTLERELEQTERFFRLSVARFGEDRLELVTDIDKKLLKLRQPSFLLQPLIENAVHHAMPSEGKLTITIKGRLQKRGAFIQVKDNGIGMNEETRKNILHPNSSKGMGIAVQNVHARVMNYFGPDTRMKVKSEPGKGTTITFRISPQATSGATSEEARKPQDETSRKRLSLAQATPLLRNKNCSESCSEIEKELNCIQLFESH